MKKYLQMGMLSLLLVSVFSACERMSGISPYAFSGSNESAASLTTENEKDRVVQAALQEDAQQARKMPLKQFARYMKVRHHYYKDYHTAYQDDFVSITVNGDKMRIETRKGKVKIEYTGEQVTNTTE
ncbi:hypothetical protein ABID22_000507 [Pontibacter aydingkolensis]|uniref:Lipoprotein n=1 Tax=Pontibacter aydingkolensis TaxID=1911536 RepID=A0ABS7CRZ0_9BACT|nr:hypothetical protein [Pontibacter aydingkolensis]MBW7466608.1 hypothetical protein [Pontibacter aydingkolensis]